MKKVVKSINKDEEGDRVTSALQDLARNLAAIRGIVNAADYNSTLTSKIDQIVGFLLPIIKKGLEEKPEQIHIDLMVVNIKYMNQLVAKQKAINPLISSELLSHSVEAEAMVIKLKALLDKDTSR